jgi:hypothetical protein
MATSPCRLVLFGEERGGVVEVLAIILIGSPAFAYIGVKWGQHWARKKGHGSHW